MPADGPPEPFGTSRQQPPGLLIRSCPVAARWGRPPLRSPGPSSVRPAPSDPGDRLLLPFDELFSHIVTTDELLDATGDRAWITALLDTEAALARAEARVGQVMEVATAEEETAAEATGVAIIRFSCFRTRRSCMGSPLVFSGEKWQRYACDQPAASSMTCAKRTS